MHYPLSVFPLYQSKNPYTLALRALRLDKFNLLERDEELLLPDKIIQEEINNASIKEKREFFTHPKITFCCQNYPLFVQIEVKKNFNFLLKNQTELSQAICQLVKNWGNKSFEDNPEMSDDVLKYFYFPEIKIYKKDNVEIFKYTKENKIFDISETIDECRAFSFRLKQKNNIYREKGIFLPLHIKKDFLITFSAIELIDFILKRKNDSFSSFEFQILIERFQNLLLEWMPNINIFEFK